MKPDDQKSAAPQLPAAPLALEGYAVLHQMFRVRHSHWRALESDDSQHRVVAAATALLSEMQTLEDGASGLFSQLGHKGDLMLLHFRRTFEELNQAEIASRTWTFGLPRADHVVSFRD